MITVNFTTCNLTVVVNNNTYVISLKEAKKVEFTTLLQACKTDENETNVKSFEEWLTAAQEVEDLEVINDLFLYDAKRDKYFFVDDEKRIFVIPSLLVDYISDLKEEGISCDPIINFFKKLRKNPNYSIDFANTALEAIMNTYLDGNRHVELIHNDYCTEAAYCDASKNAFTLTSDGNVVAFKRARFKNHKFDTTTGERIDRFPYSFDEETGEKKTIFPNKAEDFKFYPYSETISKLKLVDSETFYQVGQVINQSKGQPGFEKEESSLKFYGQEYLNSKNVKAYAENDTFVKVVINPITITSFGSKMDNLNSPIFQIVEFLKAPSDNVVDLSKLNLVAETYSDKITSEMEDNIYKYYKKNIDRILAIKAI